MAKVKSSVKKVSKPFILVSNKAKFKFVNGIVNSVSIALEKSGKKMSLSAKFKLQTDLMRMVGLINEN